MKDEALVETSEILDSVSMEGEDMFHVGEQLKGGCFRRKSLERLSRRKYSPPPSSSKRTPARMQQEILTKPSDELPTETAPAGVRPVREKRGLSRTRSGMGPTRTDGGSRGRGGPPRRAKSTLV